jgi:Flp pilus assembly protein TadG
MTGRVRREEAGSTVVFVLLMVVLIVVPVGGFGFELWRCFSAQIALASAADSAASAGGNQIDIAAYRRHEPLRLDPDRAESVAAEHLADQVDVPSLVFRDIRADESQVRVELRATVPLTFLGLFHNGPLVIVASSTSRPKELT